jgi:hypothetical protein
MERWIERYRQVAEERFRRLDAVLAEMNGGCEGDDQRAQRSA